MITASDNRTPVASFRIDFGSWSVTGIDINLNVINTHFLYLCYDGYFHIVHTVYKYRVT